MIGALPDTGDPVKSTSRTGAMDVVVVTGMVVVRMVVVFIDEVDDVDDIVEVVVVLDVEELLLPYK